MLDAFKDLGFHFATLAGITVSKNDVIIPPQKGEILKKYEGEVAEIHDQYDMGLITQEERHELVVEKWTQCTDEVADVHAGELRRAEPHLHDGQLRAPVARSPRSASWPACAA